MDKELSKKLLVVIPIVLVVVIIIILLVKRFNKKSTVTNTNTDTNNSVVKAISTDEIIEVTPPPQKPDTNLSPALVGEDAACPLYKITRRNKQNGQTTEQSLDCVATAGFNPNNCKCCEKDVMTQRRLKYFMGTSGPYCIPEYDSCFENICDNMACNQETQNQIFAGQNRMPKSSLNNMSSNTSCKDNCHNLFGCQSPHSGLNENKCGCCPYDTYDNQMVNFDGVKNSYCISENNINNLCEEACTMVDELSGVKSIDSACLNRCKNFPKCTKQYPGSKSDNEICCSHDTVSMRPMKETTGIDGKKYCVVQGDELYCKQICTDSKGVVDPNCVSKCIAYS